MRPGCGIVLLALAVYPGLLIAEPDANSNPAGYVGSAPAGLATDRRVVQYPHGSGSPPVDGTPYRAYRADQPKAPFAIERAAGFMDDVSLRWGRKHGCVTCHTNGHYLIAPPEIFKNRTAARKVREFAEDWISSWDEDGLPDTEIVVAPAAFLAINNMTFDGVLRPATLRALDEAWKLQSREGHWANWVKCNWPPFEQDDHYGVTLMTIAMGMAPDEYTEREPASTGIERLLGYLAYHEPREVHHRAMMLWAGSYFAGLVVDEDAQRWITELKSLQKASGGWASGDLGGWRQLDGASDQPSVMVAPDGDGYGTGFVLFVLLQAGVERSDPAIRAGVDWLQRNQHSDGKWFTNSLRNEPSTSNFLTHTGTTFALKALVAAGEVATGPIAQVPAAPVHTAPVRTAVVGGEVRP